MSHPDPTKEYGENEVPPTPQTTSEWRNKIEAILNKEDIDGGDRGEAVISTWPPRKSTLDSLESLLSQAEQRGVEKLQEEEHLNYLAQSIEKLSIRVENHTHTIILNDYDRYGNQQEVESFPPTKD